MDRLRPRGLAVAVAVIGFLVGPPQAVHAHERWPAWPTEIERIAEPLHRTEATREAERLRMEAIEQLDAYATAAIEPEILRALGDASSSLQRQALRICATRGMESCIPAAIGIWSRVQEGSLKMAALRVMALAPDTSTLVLLLGALKDPNDEMRAHAADLLGTAPLPGDPPSPAVEREVEDALLAKLSDPDSQVRAIAVRSLGRRGPGGGTLAIARLLEDPEPTVREAAARSLAQRRDPHAVPTLLRGLEAPNEPPVRAAILDAIAKLPGERVVPALLSALDAPPEGLTTFRVAEAIGARPDPEPELLRGLVERLADDRLARAVLRALLLFGQSVAPVLRAELDRGLEPSLHDAVERLWEATEPLPPVALAAPTPEETLEQLRSAPPAVQLRIVATLTRDPPRWFVQTLHGPLLRNAPLEVLRPWLAALASGAFASRWEDSSALRWARLIGWGADRRRSVSDRCLAISALASAPEHRKTSLRRDLQRLAEDRLPAIRACVGRTAAALELEDLTAVMLLDPAWEVRASTLRGLQPQHAATLAPTLTILARADPSSAVRTTAQHQLGGPTRASGAPFELIVLPEARPFHTGLETPVRGSDGRRWWVAPESLEGVHWVHLPAPKL